MKLQHTTKDKIWVDESGTQIPYNRTTPIERKKEKKRKKKEEASLDDFVGE